MATTIIGVFDDFTAALNLREGHSLVIVRVADVMTVQAMEILHHHRAICVDQRNLQPTADDPTELSSPSTYEN